MAHCNPSKSFLQLVRSFGRLNAADPLARCLAPNVSRGLATERRLPHIDADSESRFDLNVAELSQNIEKAGSSSSLDPARPTIPKDYVSEPNVLTTLYSWPELEPKNFAWYEAKLLNMPLRRDILHRAVVFEGDATRQGTASTKWRDDVHGSGRKILPQKGTGKARAGDKKSPIRRGGGVAFGPHPRDFSTRLQRKVYDIAWRTALSHRYRKGELIIINDEITMPSDASGRLLHNVFENNHWGKGNGRSLLVTRAVKQALFEGMRDVGEHGLVKDIEDVDVKDLLETGRIVIEKDALDTLLATHVSDLGMGRTTSVPSGLSTQSTQYISI